MKKLFSQAPLILLVIFYNSIEFSAQTYIWGGPGDKNSEFAGGLNDWTVNAVSPNDSALWLWEADGKADKGKWWYGRDAIESPSVSNGAAVFDSDYYDTGGTNGNHGDGPAPCPQTSELISPTFSCIGHESVWIRFNQYYRTWNSVTKIAVSIDNGESWIWEKILNEDISLNNSTERNSVKQINISNIAKNQTEVKIKFIWEGLYYFWILDDVYVMSNPPADPQIVGTWYPPDRFDTPKEIITHDSMKFKMRVINQGSVDSKNVAGTISIVKDDDLTSIYRDTVIFDIAAMDTIDIKFKSFVPDSDIDTGLYFALYQIDADSAASSYKKLYPQYFHVGGNYLDGSNVMYKWKYSICDNIPDQSYSYQGNNDDGTINTVIHLNYYKTGDWVDNPDIRFYSAFSYIGVRMLTPDNDNISYPIEMFVFEVADSIKDDFSNLKGDDDIIGGLQGDQLKYVGYASEIMENVSQSELLTLPLSSADNDEGLFLKPGKKYFLGAMWNEGTRYYQTTDNYYHGIKRFFYPDQHLSFIYGDYGDGPQYYGVTREIGSWMMGFISKFTVSTRENALPESTVILRQNPVNRSLEVDIKFENNIKHATMVVYDMNGSIVHIKNIYNIKEASESFDVSSLPSGIYLFTLFTKDKLSTKKFVVQH